MKQTVVAFVQKRGAILGKVERDFIRVFHS